uniref:hypothetical protein n=1 Tax=Vibrio cholerae TaxID=666 RepID=UPI001C11E08B
VYYRYYGVWRFSLNQNFEKSDPKTARAGVEERVFRGSKGRLRGCMRLGVAWVWCCAAKW